MDASNPPVKNLETTTPQAQDGNEKADNTATEVNQSVEDRPRPIQPTKKEPPPQQQSSTSTKKQRSKRQRKRPRSSVLSSSNNNTANNIISHSIVTLPNQALVRVVEPYVYTFTSYAKARWIGRPVLDIYAAEFPSYPRAYYQQALLQGRILVSDCKVTSLEQTVKGSDVLCHCVHRHEPAVAVSMAEAPFVRIVGETDTLLAVDKPANLPIHPCGGYHANSLMPLLEQSAGYDKLYTIHRLDRLTSGLVIMGKTSQEAQIWGRALQQRTKDVGSAHCQKVYVARVQGRFPLACAANNDTDHPIPRLQGPKLPLYGEWVDNETIGTEKSKQEMKHWAVPVNVEKSRQQNAVGYWISSSSDAWNISEMTLAEFSQRHNDANDVLHMLKEEFSQKNTKGKDDLPPNNNPNGVPWLHLTCPVRIANPKRGVCEWGTFEALPDDPYAKTVKPAQTSFAVVSYDTATDSTVVLCRPETGRTHQIRLHLQALGHSIANDMCYGGTMFFADPVGQAAHDQARQLLLQKDGGGPESHETPQDEEGDLKIISETPATATEVAAMTESDPWDESNETLEEYIARTCLWCARSNDPVLEYQVRSPGIWLHALQYSIRSLEIDQNQELSFCTPLPAWALL